MKALQLTEPKRFEIIDVDSPPSPGPDEVLVKINRVGVCGTDIGGYLGKFPFFSYPRIPGHELGVTIAATGRDVTHVREGDRCAVEPYINCGHCYSCRKSATNCCQTNKTLGVMCDGGLTEHMLLPARKLHPAPELTSEQAALVETLAIGCHAVDRGGVAEGENVLVIGAGPIGLSAFEFVKIAGARPIVADLSESRLAFVRDKMGVADTVQIAGDASDADRVRALTDGAGCEVVIDATGNHHSMAAALNFAAFTGRVVYVGITQQTLQIPHPPAFHSRELTLLASRNALPGDFTRIIDLIGRGEINTDTWITHHAAFDEVPQRFDDWLDPAAGVLKAIIHVD